MDSKLLELEQRIAALETQLALLQSLKSPAHDPSLPTTLVAPVQIVDGNGRLLAGFEQRTHDLSLRLFNEQGIAVATIGIDGTQAGYLAIRNAEGVLIALLDVESWGGRLQLDDHARRGGLTLFGGEGGEDRGGGIQIHHTAGGVSIALWSTAAGGEVTIYDGQPQEKTLYRLPKDHSQSE